MAREKKGGILCQIEMQTEAKHALIGSLVFVAVVVLVICIVQPWRRSSKCKAEKKVKFDMSQNQEIEPEPQPPADGADNGAPELPPTQPTEPEEGKDDTGLSKDKILRESQNDHRNKLMRGSAASNRVSVASPTTAALMMSSMDTRTLGTGKFSQGSTAGMQRMIKYNEDAGPDAEPSPANGAGLSIV